MTCSTNIKDGKVKLENMKKAELPPEMQKMTLEEQKTFLKKLEVQRQQLSQKGLELNKKRIDFIAKKQSEDERNLAHDGFDNQVLHALRRQAAAQRQYRVWGGREEEVEAPPASIGRSQA